VFLNKDNFSDIILSLLLPDYVGLFKAVPHVSVTKERPSLGPSLLNYKPVNILFISVRKEMNLRTGFIHSSNTLEVETSVIFRN